MSCTYDLGRSPKTRPYKPRLSRAVVGGQSAAVVGRTAVGSVADRSTQTKTPPKDTRDASTLSKRLENDCGRSRHVSTQTVRVHSPAVVVGYEVHDADTTKVASSTNIISAVNQVGSVAKVGSPPQRAAVHQSAGYNSVPKYSYEVRTRHYNLVKFYFLPSMAVALPLRGIYE